MDEHPGRQKLPTISFDAVVKWSSKNIDLNKFNNPILLQNRSYMGDPDTKKLKK